MSTKDILEDTFVCKDGTELFYRYYLPASFDKAVIFFHRGHEHSGRLTHLFEEITIDNAAYFAWDARGHGLSPGERGYSPNVAVSASDVQMFVEHICQQHKLTIEQISIVAQSVGAVIAATWVHDYAPNINALVLASPAFKVKLYVPFAIPALRAAYHLFGEFFVNSYVKAKLLTHDEDRIKSYEQDPLITRPIAVNMLLDLFDTSKRIVRDAGAIKVPVQLFISGSDWVVFRKPQETFYKNLGSAIKQKYIASGFFHDTLGEKNRAHLTAKISQFIEQRYSEKQVSEKKQLANQAMLKAHTNGFTFDEACDISTEHESLSWQKWYWQLTRQSLVFGSRLSEGLKIGEETGYDSGSSLDYVYRNEAQGKGFLGKLIDRIYLNSIGWRGIRQRKVHIEQLIAESIKQAKSKFGEVHVLDIAAGNGRYVLDALEKAPAVDSVTLRDYSDLNISAGNQLIESRNLQASVTFEHGDAFDPRSIESVTPKPNIVIVSGLYELFPDNDMVLTSLKAIANTIQPGGYLVYTGQPWHPQLELIARALTSHRQGEAWVMRRRTVLEMDTLVHHNGFDKQDHLIDKWGIFTVSVAQKK